MEDANGKQLITMEQWAEFILAQASILKFTPCIDPRISKLYTDTASYWMDVDSELQMVYMRPGLSICVISNFITYLGK